MNESPYAPALREEDRDPLVCMNFRFSCFVLSGWFDGQLFSLCSVCVSTVEEGLQARVRCRSVRLAVGFMLLLDW